MGSYDWESNLNFNILSLRIMGLWPKGDETYTFGFYVLYTMTAYSAFILFHVFFQVVNLYFIRDNLEALVGTSYILMIKVLSAIKAYYLIKNMRLVKQLLKILRSDLFQPKNSHQKDLVDSNISLWKIFGKCFIITCYGSNTFFAIYPLLDKSSEERRLPFLAWYPFDSKSSPLYEMTYAYQVFAVVYNTSVHINVDAVICVFNMYAGSQFDILCDDLRGLGENITSDDGGKLLRCIHHHKLILEYIKKNNIFFNWIVFFQFFISSVSIGMTMFQLTLVVPLSSQFTSLICYGVAITIQIFLFCWYGNEVQEKSANLAYAVFESNWIEMPPKIKKILIIFTIRLLQLVRLSAWNLFYLTLETFMGIMKTAWSYFAFLHQVGSRQ